MKHGQGKPGVPQRGTHDHPQPDNKGVLQGHSASPANPGGGLLDQPRKMGAAGAGSYRAVKVCLVATSYPSWWAGQTEPQGYTS